MTLGNLEEGVAHLVLANEDKVAVQVGWNKQSATLAAALAHRKRGGLVGIIPGRSQIAVLDVDDGDPAELLRDWPPLATVTTRSGGKHLLYARPENGIGNCKWEAYGCKGDVRCDAGYCIVWDDEKWIAAIQKVQHGDGVFVNAFPNNIIGRHSKKVTHGERLTRVAVTPEMARAYLKGIDPDCVYEDWIRVGQALHDAFGGNLEGLGLWDSWSRGGTKYDSSCRKHWDTFTLGGGVSWGTIVSMSSGHKVAAYTPDYKDADEPIVVEGSKTPAAMLEALNRLGIQLRYNLRLGKAEITRPGDDRFMMLNDYTAAGTAWFIRDKVHYLRKDNKLKPLFFGRDLRKDCFNALLYREDLQVDPFLVFIDSLPPWDGQERYEHWLADLLGAEPTRLAKWASRYPFLGAVQRAYEPGAKIDEIPVLIGSEGIGKSTALRMIMPEEQPTLFGDGLVLNETAQKQVEATLGRALIELSELTGINRTNSASLKAFISRQDDGALRMAYGHGPEPRPRRFVMVGTTNETDILPYEKENRRWVPLKLGESSGPAETYFREELDGHSRRIHMWAEALHAYRGGMTAGLPRELKAKQREAANKHRYRDDIMDEKIDQLRQEPMSLKEICEDLYIDVNNRRDQSRLRYALKTNGWEYDGGTLVTRPNGKRARLWYPPGYER